MADSATFTTSYTGRRTQRAAAAAARITLDAYAERPSSSPANTDTDSDAQIDESPRYVQQIKRKRGRPKKARGEVTIESVYNRPRMESSVEMSIAASILLKIL